MICLFYQNQTKYSTLAVVNLILYATNTLAENKLAPLVSTNGFPLYSETIFPKFPCTKEANRMEAEVICITSRSHYYKEPARPLPSFSSLLRAGEGKLTLPMYMKSSSSQRITE